MAKQIHEIKKHLPKEGWARNTVTLEKHAGLKGHCHVCFSKVLDPKDTWIENRIEPETIFEWIKKFFGLL